MGTFLTRLKEAISGAHRGVPRHILMVRRDDLREIVHHFERLDSEARARYEKDKILGRSNGWQPIESAPEKTEIIVYGNFKQGDPPEGRYFTPAIRDGKQFIAIDENGEEYECGWVTHWAYPPDSFQLAMHQV